MTSWTKQNLDGGTVGRPWLYGLIVGGQAGAEQVIQHMMADLDTTLGLSGYKTLSEVQGKGDAIVMKLDLWMRRKILIPTSPSARRPTQANVTMPKGEEAS